MDAYQLFEGDVVRIQLSPDGSCWRYEYDLDNQMYDRGYGGEWVSAQITEVNIHNIAVAIYQNLQSEVLEVRFPLPGHPAFMEERCKLPGYPMPPRFRAEVPSCDCGCEAADDGGTHYTWCSKRTHMEKHGLM